MFRQKPQAFSIISLFESPNEYSFSGMCTWGGGGTSFGVTSTRYGSSEIHISSLNDFNTRHFNLLNLCKLWGLHLNKASTQIQLMVSCFFRFLKQAAPQEKEKYLFQFFGKTTYQDLQQIRPDAAEALMKLLFDFDDFGDYKKPETKNKARFHGLDKIPPILLQYADHLARQFTRIPQELLQEFDILAAESQCFYKTMPLDKQAGKVEGYWKPNYVNESLVAAAKEKMQNKTFSAEALQGLKNLVLEKENPDEDQRYPIPEPAPWPNKDKLLQCLRALEKIATQTSTELKALLALRVQDERILRDLLFLSVRDISYMGPSPERLPIDYYSYHEYAVTLPDESRIAWTQALSKYIEVYNVMPSREFLTEFNNFLLYCKSAYLDASNNLKQYLDNHPLDCEQSNTSSLMPRF